MEEADLGLSGLYGIDKGSKRDIVSANRQSFVNLFEGSFVLKSVKLPEVLRVDANAQLRVTILDKDDIPDVITVEIEGK